ncbi:MAG: hypothetical protein OEU80_03985 [Deltaproteobacteria bacterium]|nr:hypothetical protein [Deltaproteobacteria bacterium]
MVEKESYSIQLEEVDWNDTSCLITYGPLPDKLILSIQTVGLIQKPLLQRKKRWTFAHHLRQPSFSDLPAAWSESPVL